MFMEERREAIARLVAEGGRVSVRDLVERFGVTQDCIRKDLRALEAAGACRRVHGGAVRAGTLPETEVQARKREDTGVKRALAARAYELVPDGGCIYLDISTTNLALAEQLRDGSKACTVVTNLIEALEVLATNPRVTAIGTGGTVDAETGAFCGSAALAAVARYRFDCCFVGALGIEPVGGAGADAAVSGALPGAAMTLNEDDAAIKRAAIENSDRAYLVTAAGKFGKRGRVRYAELSEFDQVITDRG